MVEDSYYRLNRADCLNCNFQCYLSPKQTRNITVASEIVRKLFNYSWFRRIKNTKVSKMNRFESNTDIILAIFYWIKFKVKSWNHHSKQMLLAGRFSVSAWTKLVEYANWYGNVIKFLWCHHSYILRKIIKIKIITRSLKQALNSSEIFSYVTKNERSSLEGKT